MDVMEQPSFGQSDSNQVTSNSSQQMQNQFVEFNILDLLQADPDIRKKAEKIKSANKAHSQIFIRFLTAIVTTSQHQNSIVLALSILKELVLDSCDESTIIQTVHYYSQLYLKSQLNDRNMRVFDNLLETMFNSLDSLQKKSKRTEKIHSVPVGCYKQALKLFLSGQNEYSQKLLLSYICNYLEYVQKNNIQHQEYFQISIQGYYQHLKKIRGNPQQNYYLQILKAKFFIFTLQNHLIFSPRFFQECLFLIPNIVLRYAIKMFYKKKMRRGDVISTLDFIFKQMNHSLWSTVDCDTCISLCQLFNLLIDKYFDLKFYPSNRTIIEQANFQVQTLKLQQNYIELFLPESIRIMDWNIFIIPEQFFICLPIWIIKMLERLNLHEQEIILKISLAIQPFFNSISKSIVTISQTVILTEIFKSFYEKLSQKDKNSSFFEFYLLGIYFRSTNNNQQIFNIIQTAIDLLKQSLIKQPILFFMRKVITCLPKNSLYAHQICKNIKSTVMKTYSSLQPQQLSQALLIVFSGNDGNQGGIFHQSEIYQQQSQEMDLWAFLSTCPVQQRITSLQVIQRCITLQKHVYHGFLAQFIGVLNETPDIFDTYYSAEPLSIRSQYLSLIHSCISCVDKPYLAFFRVIQFLQQIFSSNIRQCIQLDTSLAIVAQIAFESNLRKIVSVQFLNLISKLVDDRIENVLEQQRLLIQLMALKYYNPNQIANFQDEEIYIKNELTGKIHEKIIEKIIFNSKNQKIDQKVDALQVWINLNPNMCNEHFTSKVLSCFYDNKNFYRLTYLLSPQPYPKFSPSQPLTELKYLKWKALFIMGKVKKHVFVALRSKQRQALSLIKQMGSLGSSLSVQDKVTLSQVKRNIQSFKKDDESSWISGLSESSLSQQLQEFYIENYSKDKILEDIETFLNI